VTTRVATIGAGSWGTALASLLSGKGHDVLLWARSAEVANSINERHENRPYLPGVPLPPALRATTDLHEALDEAELVVAVVPSHAMRDTMERAARVMRDDAIVVSASKGIEDETLLSMHGVIAEAIDDPDRVAALSGPSFAVEVASGKPAVVVAAATTDEVAERVQHYFHAPMLRVYRSTDMVGVELGGVVKNVMAIATGVSDGLGYGLNARAATITRGLAEIMRLAISMGARAETLSGLAGIGDLVLTCTGDLSRNRQVGLRLGRGETIDDILGGMRMVAEGVRNTKAVRALASRQGVEMPIVECAYKVLYEGLPPGQALEELFARRLKPEFP
jgi:glycerol-3-phosphate dehydrogenase (NAD(P)+)